MCAICDLRLEFTVEHPLSLSVAVATRQAIDASLLPNPPEDDPIDAAALRIKAVAVLKAIQRRLEHVLAGDQLPRLPDFFVLMIESRTWGFFRPTADGFDPGCRREPPRPFARDASGGDAVVLASETVMQQLLSGKLSFEQASAQGLIVIDADGDSSPRLWSVWNAGFPKVGLSSFVPSAATPLTVLQNA